MPSLERLYHVVVGALLLLPACVEHRTTPASARRDALTLLHVDHGRLVDVYGLAASPIGPVPVRFRDDVVVGAEVWGEPPPSTWALDGALLVALPRDPETLQPRVLIQREIGSAPFTRAFDALDDRVVALPLGRAEAPAVVPRDAAFRLTFGRDLDLPARYFVRTDDAGRTSGLANELAIQLVDLDRQVALPVRCIARGSEIVVDPVWTGTEGPDHGVPNRAAGLPPARDAVHANLRLVLPLDAPAALPGLRATAADSERIAADIRGQPAIAADFRTARDDERGEAIERGRLPSPDPLRLLCQVPLLLDEIDTPSGPLQRVVAHRHFRHRIDRGDRLLIAGRDGARLGHADVLAVEGPGDDGAVGLVIGTTPGLAELDPRRDPARPVDPRALRAWLEQAAPRATLLAELDAGDDPRAIVRAGPAALPLADGAPSPPGENLSPFAALVVRFSKPLDPASARPHDTIFVATRDVLDRESLARDFAAPRGLDPARLNLAKVATPHLVAARLFDERGDHTQLRLVPLQGLYLDETMRRRDRDRPFAQRELRYWLHVRGGDAGVRDLAGRPLELGGAAHVVAPFGLDLRSHADGRPIYADNLVAHVVRAFADSDEDERPSYYRPDELHGEAATAVPDVFGAVTHLAGGGLLARPTSRVTRTVDDANQPPPPDQSSVLRHCPIRLDGDSQIPSRTAQLRSPAALANPFNPAGARLQAVWRDVDLGLSLIDAHDFDLDVERLYWAPFQGTPIVPDAVASASLYLGHSERRPEPCVGSFSALPSLPGSGLGAVFDDNFAHDIELASGLREEPRASHAGFVDTAIAIDPRQSCSDPTGRVRYLPLPPLAEPLFTWRDQRLTVQGGASGGGTDSVGANAGEPWLASPWRGGLGRAASEKAPHGTIELPGTWENRSNFHLLRSTRRDAFTGGGLLATALPLLLDFHVPPDDELVPPPFVPPLPGSPAQYRGPGDVLAGPTRTGWQTSIAIGTGPLPNFRAYSAGFAGLGVMPPITLGPSDPEWSIARGGYTPSGSRTAPLDNTVLWIAADLLERRTVATWGFVDVFDPHRVAPGATVDPRLGPWPRASLPGDVRPRFDSALERATDWPAGASVQVQFRAAGEVDPDPWRWRVLGAVPALRPDADNFPLDPYKACDAGIRKYDDRMDGGAPRHDWTHLYTRRVTDYTDSADELFEPAFTRLFGSTGAPFTPGDVRYFHWRIVIENGPEPAIVTPALASFALAYRFERR